MLAAALAVVLAAGTAWSLNALAQDESQQPWPGRGTRGPAVPPDIQQALGLSDEQASQLRAMHFESAKARIKTRSEIQLKRLELEELLRAEETDQGAIDKTLRALSDAQYTAMKDRVAHRLALRQILTPEQLKKMEGMKRQFMRHRMGRSGGRGLHGPRGGPGFGPGGRGRGDRGFGPGAFGPGDDGPAFGAEPEMEPDFELDIETLDDLAEPAI